jgi:hypothetical protein
MKPLGIAPETKSAMADLVNALAESMSEGAPPESTGPAKVVAAVPTGWGQAGLWRPTPPNQEGFYWLKRRDESLTVVYISRSLLAYSTHGHSGSKPGSLQGLWAGPLTVPSADPNEKAQTRAD